MKRGLFIPDPHIRIFPPTGGLFIPRSNKNISPQKNIKSRRGIKILKLQVLGQVENKPRILYIFPKTYCLKLRKLVKL